MIKPDEILKYIKMEPKEAEQFASELNILSENLDIDSEQIKELLQKDPEQLLKQKYQVEIEQSQLKKEFNKKMFEK